MIKRKKKFRRNLMVHHQTTTKKGKKERWRGRRSRNAVAVCWTSFASLEEYFLRPFGKRRRRKEEEGMKEMKGKKMVGASYSCFYDYLGKPRAS